MMKTIRYFILFSILCSLNAYAGKNNEQKLDQVIAIVNNSVITQSELNQAVNRIKKQLIANNTTIPNLQSLQKKVLEQLITKKIQLDIATQMGIHPTPTEIDKAIATIAANNHLTVDRLYEEVNRQGLTKADYRSEIKDEYTLHKVEQQAIGHQLAVSSEEVNDFMRSGAWLALSAKEYHLEDILITLPESPSLKQIQEARQHAESVLQKLHAGASFHELAFSDSSSDKALQGGDLGWRKLPEIPSAFSSRLLEMKVNDIAGPIQTPNGFHIIHVAGMRDAAMIGSEAEQRNKVKELLYERKFEEALQSWLTKVRSEAFVNVVQEG